MASKACRARASSGKLKIKPKAPFIFALLCWLVLIALGLLLDRAIAQWIAQHTLDKRSTLAWLMKSPGHFGFTSMVMALLILFHCDRWRGAGLVLLSAAIGGLLYAVIKWSVGRVRPVKGIDPFAFHPFQAGLRGLSHAENLSFPSGHACLAFATAASLAMLLPRWRYAFYAAAAIVGLERVLENAHYLTDVIAAAAIGIISAHLAAWLGKKLGCSNDPGALPADSAAPARITR